MYESIQGYHTSSASSPRKNLSSLDLGSSPQANVGDAVLTEQKMLDHVSAMEVRMMASYEEAKRASAMEASTTKASEIDSGSEKGSTIVAKHCSAGPFSILASGSRSSPPPSPRGGKWVDVPQCPAVESCFLLSKLPLPPEDSAPEKGEKSKHVGNQEEENEAHHFLRPSSAAPWGSKKDLLKKSSKKEGKPSCARPDPFWNEQVDWTPGLALKYSLPQTDLIEVAIGISISFPMLMQVLHNDRLILLELPQPPTLLDQLNQLARLVSL